MKNQLFGLRGCLLMAALLLASHASAQNQLSSDIIASPRPLSADQRDQVSAYVRHWTAQLTVSPDTPQAPTVIRNARSRLINPATQVSATLDFRRAYSDVIVPELSRIVGGNNTLHSVNAMSVLVQVGTDQALDVLIAHLDSSSHPVRHSAIRFARDMVEGFLQNRNLITAGRMSTLAREVADAATAESSAMTLQRQFETLDAIQLVTRTRPAMAQLEGTVLDLTLDVLRSRAQRLLAAETPSSDIGVLHRALVVQREDFIRRNQTQRMAVGPRLVVIMTTLLEAGSAHWDQAQANPGHSVTYLSAIEFCDEFMKLIDSSVRDGGQTPNTQLRQAWAGRDRDAYNRQFQQWQSVRTGQDPYRNFPR